MTDRLALALDALRQVEWAATTKDGDTVVHYCPGCGNWRDPHRAHAPWCPIRLALSPAAAAADIRPESHEPATMPTQSNLYVVEFGNRGRTGARELGGNGADPEPSFTVEAANEEEARDKACAQYLMSCLADPTDSRHPNVIAREFHRENAVIGVRIAARCKASEALVRHDD